MAPPRESTDPRDRFQRLRAHLNGCVLGQPALIDRLLLALLADGHLLVEGAPGLAKTTAIDALAAAVPGTRERIQLTPDLQPRDIIGSDVVDARSGELCFRPGPLMHNIVLAEEINRAPTEVQSALFKAMAERRITVGSVVRRLPEPFLVLATQNPRAQRGTCPLREAQLDRFLMHVRVGYPSPRAERQVLALVRARARRGSAGGLPPLHAISEDMVVRGRSEALDVRLSSALEQHMVELIRTTCDPATYGEDIARWVARGAGPRGAMALDRCARARAWLYGRDFVTADDVFVVAKDVLRHRVTLSPEAEASRVTPDDVITTLLSRVPL